MDRRCFRTPAPASAPRRRRSTTEAPSRANTGSDLQRVLRWDAFKQVCKLQLATRLVKFIRIGPAGSSAGCEPHVPPGSTGSMDSFHRWRQSTGQEHGLVQDGCKNGVSL
ncbi:uncharacterized protein LOC119326658 isoform X2 [Triticum dicoccoides]|uniref:uncharacterized protein LOC119326658 isoform X2 n=1 Tax=Triticum dicoccoides TaxID=85692 RepID=UPI000E7A0FD9|nr:uncharacterized protein LOC119326658 isoform X2 [Triticum dicoccoides]